MIGLKKILFILIGTVLAIISICIAGYPFISDYINSSTAKSSVMQFLEITDNTSESELNEKLKAAQDYNKSLVGSVVISDPFEESKESNEDVAEILKIDVTDVIATVNIPKINSNLPVYFGTDDETLKKGAGLLSRTSLPVGGKGTHSVITGHTGYSFLKLFSDLNKLEVGDKFYVSSLGQTLAYEVDNVAVVLPEETELLQISPDKDYVTLVTCTPFGVNSHRLLVRGTRVPYSEDEEKSISQTQSTWTEEYFSAIIIGVVGMLSVVLIYVLVRIILYFNRKRKKNENRNS